MPRKYALTLAYEHYNRYLGSDSADSGPIEDYIAAAITEGMTQTARRCAEKLREQCQLLNDDAAWMRQQKCFGAARNKELVADALAHQAAEIRREFGLEQGR